MIFVNLTEIRKELQITQQDLSERCLIGRSTLSEIENGKHTPSIEIACRICYVLHVRLKDVFLYVHEEDLDIRPIHHSRKKEDIWELY